MNKTFYNLKELVSVPLSDKYQEEGKWQGMYYESEGKAGIALVAGECIDPPAIELDLEAKGWHRIYIALGGLGGKSAVGVSISGEDGKTVIAPTNIEYYNNVWNWGGYNFGEESFFKATDLTGKKLIFEKPASLDVGGVSVVLYVRIEEMSDSEVAEYLKSGSEKRILYHFDQDYTSEMDYKTAEDYLGRMKMLEHGNGEIIDHECFLEMYSGTYNTDKTPWKNHGKSQQRLSKFIDRQVELKRLFSETANKMNMKIYGGYRIEMGDFTVPYNPSYANDGAWETYSEFCCMTRDGKPINVLSYAYPEVRKMMVDNILKTLPDEWDGVSLYFHRGLFVSFEKPVLDEVKKRFCVDARRLPRKDERLQEVQCGYITEFIRELTVALKEKADKVGHERYKINIVTLYSAAISKEFGCDVETLLKEKLIDSVSQGIMGHYETIDDCIAEDGLIDLNKYSAKKKCGYTIIRNFADDVDIIVDGAKEFLDIQKKYGGEFYAALGWENRSYSYQCELSKKLYEIGVEKFISWNANHQAKFCARIQGIKTCGDKQRILDGSYKISQRTFRLTNINGSDISEFDPNWRG